LWKNFDKNQNGVSIAFDKLKIFVNTAKANSRTENMGDFELMQLVNFDTTEMPTELAQETNHAHG
jgi:hypothetical protein